MPTKEKSRWGTPHTFRPDADNLAKLALDAMMKAGLMADDSIVSSLLIRKTWAQEGGLTATIKQDSRPQPYQDRPDWI